MIKPNQSLGSQLSYPSLVSWSGLSKLFIVPTITGIIGLRKVAAYVNSRSETDALWYSGVKKHTTARDFSIASATLKSRKKKQKN